VTTPATPGSPAFTIPPPPRASVPDVSHDINDAAAAAAQQSRRVDYVTVQINPEDGLLATKWTPEVIEKRYLKGTQPTKYSTMYAPPPGEH
jgi:hypothetical protein